MVHPLDAGILAFLGRGESSFPRRDASAVVGGPAGELLAEVTSIVDECVAIEVDWTTTSLTDGGRHARAVMAHRHPSLSPTALDALEWAFTYAWR